MSSIDNRIVQMEFDNAKFERGVATTMQSLSGLDDQINSIAKNRSFDGLADSVDSIADRFSNMGVIGMSVIQNITDRVVDLGINMTKSLTIDNVAAGFQKYESITKETQAIVNQAKVSYDEAAGYIEKLAWYSDATSFDLSAMVGALKQFVSQGIKMEDAIPIIMGIGNSVTFAGTSAKEGSAAFATYAKAIASGNLTRIQWMSLTQGLHVTTQQLKQDMIDAAVAVGTLTKGWDGLVRTAGGDIVNIATFEETLNRQDSKFVNAEVISKVFGEKYGAYASNIADATIEWQKLNNAVLDTDTALDMFGDESDVIGRQMFESAFLARTFSEAIDAVKDAVSTQIHGMFQSIFGSPEEAIELWTDLNTFLVDKFATPFSNMATVLSEWHDFGKGIGGRGLLIEGIKYIYGATESYLKPVAKFLENTFPKVTGEGLYEATVKFYDFAEGMHKLLTGDAKREWEQIQTEIAEGSFFQDNDFSAWSDFDFSDWVKHWEDYVSIGDRLNNIIEGLASAFGLLKRFVKTVTSPFTRLWKAIKYAGDGFLTVLSNIGLYITGIENSESATAFFEDALNFLSIVIEYVSQGIEWLTDKIVEFSESKSVKEALEKLGEFLGQIFEEGGITKVGTGVIQTIIKGLGDLGKALSELFSPSFGDGIGSSFLVKAMVTLYALRTALDYAGVSTRIQDIWSDIKSPLGGITRLLNQISFAFSNFINAVKMNALKSLAITIALFALSLILLSSIDWEKLKVGLGAMAIGILELIGAMWLITKVLTTTKGVSRTVSALIKVSIALLILSSSMKKLANLNYDDITTGLFGIAGMLLELFTFMLLISVIEGKGFNAKNVNKLRSLAITIGIMSAVLVLLSKSFEDPDELVEAGAVIAASMLALILFLGAIQSIPNQGFLSNPKNANSLLKMGLAMTLFAAGIGIIAAAVTLLSYMSWDQMKVGLISLVVSLAAIAIFGAALHKIAGQFVAIGAGLVIFAAAMLVIAGAMTILGSIGLDGMTEALLSLFLVLAMIGVFTAVMSAMILPLIGVGAGLLVLSAALVVLAAAVGILGAIGIEGITAALIGIAGALTIFGIAGAVIGAPAIVVMIALAAAIVALGLALNVLGEALTKIATAWYVFKAAMLMEKTQFIDNTVKTKETVLGEVNELTRGITDAAQDTSASLKATDSQIVDDVESTTDQVETDVSSSSNFVTNMLQSLGVDSDNITSSMMDNLGTSWADGTGNIETVLAGFSGNAVGQFENLNVDVSGITSMMSSNLLTQGQGMGSNLVSGIIQGIKSLWNRAKEAMINLGNSMTESYQYTMGIYSPSRVFAEFGRYIDLGLVEGINQYQSKVVDSSNNLGKSVLNAFSGPMAELASLAEKDLSISPKITPVIDASNIQNGQKYLSSMLGGGILAGSINGTMNPNTAAIAGIRGEMAVLKNQIASMSSGQLDESTLSRLLANSMRNVEVNMDGTKVGKLVSNYQRSANRASGI